MIIIQEFLQWVIMKFGHSRIVSVKQAKEISSVNGHFITLEGGEGAGKTSVLHNLEKKLVDNGYDVLTTREPGGIEIAEKIRKVILDPSHTKMDARTEAL